MRLPLILLLISAVLLNGAETIPQRPGQKKKKESLGAESVSNGFMRPDYYPENINQLRSMFKGQTAKPIGGNLWEITDAAGETFSLENKSDLKIKSPDCIYDYESKNAYSSNRMEASKSGDLF